MLNTDNKKNIHGTNHQNGLHTAREECNWQCRMAQTRYVDKDMSLRGNISYRADEQAPAPSPIH